MTIEVRGNTGLGGLILASEIAGIFKCSPDGVFNNNQEYSMIRFKDGGTVDVGNSFDELSKEWKDILANEKV